MARRTAASRSRSLAARSNSSSVADAAASANRAATVAAVRAGEFRDLYRVLVARGMREELARLTLTRKLAALTLRLWKTGERYDAKKLTSYAVPAR